MWIAPAGERSSELFSSAPPSSHGGVPFANSHTPFSLRGPHNTVCQRWTVFVVSCSLSRRPTSRWKTPQMSMLANRDTTSSNHGLPFQNWSTEFSCCLGWQCYGHGKSPDDKSMLSEVIDLTQPPLLQEHVLSRIILLLQPIRIK